MQPFINLRNLCQNCAQILKVIDQRYEPILDCLYSSSPSLTPTSTNRRKRRSSISSEEAKDAVTQSHRGLLSVPSQRRRHTSEGDTTSRNVVPVPFQFKRCPTSINNDHSHNEYVSEHSTFPSQKRRHNSEGEAYRKRIDPGPLDYSRYQSQTDGTFNCDGQKFHVKSLKTEPEIMAIKPNTELEIKQALLEVSPQITPGQSTPSYYDLVWDMSEPLPSIESDSNCSLRSLLSKINQLVQNTVSTDVKYNGIRLIYAYDRTVKLKLEPVNQSGLPLTVLHIGKRRDLSITPTRFNPAVQSTEICDVLIGNFTMVIFPHESIKNVHTFFATETSSTTSGNEEILLIPFFETTASALDTSASPNERQTQNTDKAYKSSTSKYSELESSVKPCETPSVKPSERQNPQPVDAKPTLGTTDSKETKSVNGDPNPNTDVSITLKYITLDLLQRAASSYKKSTLTSLITSLGIKSSNNVSKNKRILCDLLEECESIGSKDTVNLVTHLINKLEDNIIRMELLANHLPLNISAQERKRALVSFCKTQSRDVNDVVKLVFDNPGKKVFGDTRHNNASQVQVTTSPGGQPSGSPCLRNVNDSITPETPHTGNTEKKFDFPSVQSHSKKKRHKVKKEKKKSQRSSCGVPYANSQQTVHDIIEPGGQLTENIVEKDVPSDLDRLAKTECSNCSELRTAVTVLQESICSIKEEMLQQKALSDLIVSSPTISDKNMDRIVKSKVSPLEDKVRQLRVDLNLLRDTVDEQNRTLEIIANREILSLQEVRAEVADSVETFEKASSTSKRRFEDLEIEQDKLKKALRSTASSAKNETVASIDSLRNEFNNAFQSLDTVSSSNRTRIEALETNHENVAIVLANDVQPVVTHISKPDTATRDVQRNGPNATGTPDWASIAAANSGKPFTKANRSNNKNHRERKLSQSERLQNGSRGNQRTNSPTGGGQEDNDSRMPHRREDHVPSSTSQSREVGPGTGTGTRNSHIYRRHTVLLIHDSNFDKFNPRSFSSQFNVHQFGASSFENLVKKRKQLNEKLNKLRPDCVYVHLGINDLTKRKCTPSGAIHELAGYLLETCKAQICFSLLIPTSNNKKMNERFKAVNNEIKSNVSWFHRQSETARSRIFTFANDLVGNQNSYSFNTGFTLKDRGEKLLYVSLREGLKKTMRIPHQSHDGNPRQKRSSNRFKDE